MPVTDFSGGGGWPDWLQSLMQNQGAGQPYGPGGAPGPYSGGPQGLMPGGGVMNYQGATPGQPSMGYPAMGQPLQGPPSPTQALQAALAQGQPQDPRLAAAANLQQPAPGMSLASNPITNAASGAYGNIHDWLTAHAGAPSWWGGGAAAASPAAPATAPPAPATKRTDAAYGPYNAPGGGGIGAGYNYPTWPSGGGSAGPEWSNMPDAAARPANAAMRRPSYTGQAVGAGEPTGQPSATPRPGGSSASPNLGRYPPFSMIDRVNAGPVAQPGRGYQTALDLSRLFGGGGAQSAPAAAPNPANLPAPNAQPVSAAAPTMSNAPWNYGPLQRGNIWASSGGPHQAAPGLPFWPFQGTAYSP